MVKSLVATAVAAALSLAACFLAPGLVAPARAQLAEAPSPPHQNWSFDGIFGTYNDASLQRGFQVYKEVCSACHRLNHLDYRDLTKIGFSDAEVAAIASQYQVTDGPNDKGQMFQRPARPSDAFVGPFPNEEAARAANNGAAPPDLSMIVNARAGGADYVYAILNGFIKPPAGVKVPEGLYYNEYFPGHMIHMPPPLSDGAVKFADGTPSTVPHMAHDVATFLTWASKPNLDERHRMGLKVILFLVIAAGVFYAAKRRVWSRIHH